MLGELATETFDPIKWMDENFEDRSLCDALMERVNLWSVLLPLPTELFFFSGLSIGVQLGKRLAQIEMLDEKVND
jgi:hypothetical protein